MDNPTDEITVRIARIYLEDIVKDFSRVNIEIQLANILKQSIHYGLSEWQEIYKQVLTILGVCLKVQSTKAYNSFIECIFEERQINEREEAENNIQEIVNSMRV
jgi:hypothetical protein